MKARKGLFPHPNQTAAAQTEEMCKLHLYPDGDGYILVVHTRTIARLSAETDRKLRRWQGELPELVANFGGNDP